MALYPPIVASSMPAFDIADGKVRVYYTLSTYNTVKLDEIRAVHVTVRRQTSNINVLKKETEIIEKNLEQDDIDKIYNRYHVDILNDQLKDGFEADALYKVQLRFSTNAPSNNSTSQTYADINKYSEWSTVCIIKPINAPLFYIDDFYIEGDEGSSKQTDENNFFSTLADFIGIYKQRESKETLKYWRLRLLSDDFTEDDILNIDNYTLSDSGWVLNEAENYNLNDASVSIACSLPYELTDKVNYKLFFEIQTRNGYENNVLYNFTCTQSNVDTLVGTLNTYINEEEGYIKLKLLSNETDMTNLVIRRSDSSSDFKAWKDLKYFQGYNNLNFEYYDFTVQSGIFYRYLVQKVDARGRRGTPLYDSSRSANTGVMAEWDHAFLLESTGNGELAGTKQLKLKYDFSISSYKTNISESKTDTIGSKYPFIRRNGNMYYRSFPITGTITEFMDEADLFTNSETLFDNYYGKYKDFKGQIGEHVVQYDYTYERKFREKVEEFLYNSKPKLYKSMQQGNIFIKLMQVSLTPKNELGRLVYSFSATAYQIDEPVIQTYNNYGLIHIGTFNPNISATETVLKQISSYDFNENIMGNLFKAGQDIIGGGQATAAANSIAKSIKYNQPMNNMVVTDFTINWLRLTIESQPYLIIEEGPNNYRPYDDVIPSYVEKNKQTYIDKNITRNGSIESIANNNYQDDISSNSIDYPLYQIQSTYRSANNSDEPVNVYLGWLFNINGQQIIISPPNNIYEIKEDAFTLKRGSYVIPAKDTAMLVDFRLIETKNEDLSDTPKNRRFNQVNGQLMGTYSQDMQLISRINYKYKYVYESGLDKIKRQVNGVHTVLVDTQPGTIIKVRTTAMQNEARFVVNETGELNFDPIDSSINIISLKIAGLNILLDNVNNLGQKESLSDILSPKEGDMCKVNDNIYYYHMSTWYSATEVINDFNQSQSIDVSCPVDALVFYFASIREDIY